MSFNINTCDKSCIGCIKGYKNKHSLKAGGKFNIRCAGIPEDYAPDSIMHALPAEERDLARSMLDPVEWAAKTLDWHCLDPNGEVWKRKNPQEYYAWLREHPNESILGKSRYHRPYQAQMLRCTSKRKIFRIGRQAGKTETMVIAMLFCMFTKPDVAENEGFEVIVITPFQAQIEVIFTRIQQLISTSAITQNSVRRDVKAPIYTIELHNSSKIRGFTAGTKSGGNADSVRGQHANMLVFDEADYLSSKDMDSAMSIITNFPQATLWMSSTPSGRRDKFYQSCQSDRFKEFFFPSYVNPLWSTDLAATYKETMTSIAYKHEIEADFGEQEEGVFQNAYIQSAKKDYRYGQLPPTSGWTYTMGVDWNDTANGTTIAIIGFDPTQLKFILVDRHIVSRDGWTQVAAMTKIVELNRIWNPIAIYIDAGHGGTQWELLRKYGYDAMIEPSKGARHPDSRLKDIVKKYDFGSKVETRDLFTKQIIQKPAKPFLVESTVRRFEAGDFCFSMYDEVLEKQLGNYIIDRVTPTGLPVYKPLEEAVGDHTLDAVMLSLLAFVMEISPLGKPKYETGFAFSGGFGDATEAMQDDGLRINSRSKQETFKEAREESRPAMNRAAIHKSSIGISRSLPAAHTVGLGRSKPWGWSGFLSDQPPPQTRSWEEAEGDARNRMGMSPNRVGRPRRRNI